MSKLDHFCEKVTNADSVAAIKRLCIIVLINGDINISHLIAICNRQKKRLMIIIIAMVTSKKEIKPYINRGRGKYTMIGPPAI